MALKKHLLIILLVTCLIRFSGLLPQFTHPGVYIDEAAIGYTAYSFTQTGLDEYGQPWPILLRTFGAYSSSLYAYLLTPFISVFHLTNAALRLPSVISGILIVLVSAVLGGPVLAWVVALSPVFVFFSRGAFEANLGLLLLLTSITCLVRSRHRLVWLIVGFGLLSLSAYAYQAERFLSLLFLGFFTFKFRSRQILLPLVLALLIQLPLLWVSFTPAGLHRATSLNTTETSFTYRYLAYFSPNNLFNKPDPDPQRAYPDTSVFYWWLVIPAFLGLTKLLSRPSLSSLKSQTLLLLVLASPIPAALTKDYFSTLRALPLFLPLSLVIAKGISSRLGIALLLILGLLGLYSQTQILRHERSTVWNYEFAQIAQFIHSHPSTPILIDNSRQKPVDVLLRYYLQPSPKALQSNYSDTWRHNYYSHLDYSFTTQINQVSIRPINWESDIYLDQFIISDPLGISASQVSEHFLQPITSFSNLSSQPTYSVYRTQPDLKCRTSSSPLCPPKKVVMLD